MQSISRSHSHAPSFRPHICVKTLPRIECFAVVKRSFRSHKIPVSLERLGQFGIMPLAGAALAAPAGGVISGWFDSCADDAGWAA